MVPLEQEKLCLLRSVEELQDSDETHSVTSLVSSCFIFQHCTADRYKLVLSFISDS